MQDKEFDDLFRSKLDNFEITPTAGVWEGISDALEPRKRKTSLAFIMSIAASIIVIMAVGVLFIPQKVKVNGGKTGRPLVAVAVAAKHSVYARRVSEPVSAKSKSQAMVQSPVNRIAQAYTVKTSKHIRVKQQEPVIDQSQPVKTGGDETQLAVAEQRHDIITDAVVPGKETLIAIQLPVAASQDFITKPAITATQLPAAEKPDVAHPVKKRYGIRTLGDLINVVVAKVDKRKDKFIEFTNSDDDDESNITGVNLGVIKVKK